MDTDMGSQKFVALNLDSSKKRLHISTNGSFDLQ